MGACGRRRTRSGVHARLVIAHQVSGDVDVLQPMSQRKVGHPIAMRDMGYRQFLVL